MTKKEEQKTKVRDCHLPQLKSVHVGKCAHQIELP